MLHERHRNWIEARGLDPVLAEKLGLVTVTDGKSAWLSLPYSERGQVVNHKYRMTSEKRHRMDPDAPLCLWNHDVLLDEKVRSGQQAVLITEGEWDAMAAIQSGFRHVVSVPNGAPAEETADISDPANRRYQFLWRSRELLDQVGEFIIATDGDGPGRVLASDLVRWLGPERCKFVTYPFECKDLNDVLIKYGAENLLYQITEAKPYPVKGLFRLSDFPDPGPQHVIPIGVPGLNQLINIVPASLTVLTGYAGEGKTSLTMSIVAHLLTNNIPVCMGTFETLPKPVLQARLRAAIMRTGERIINPAECAVADNLIEENLSIIAQMVGEDDEMDLDEILDRAAVAIKRDGARVLILDPWNEIEHKHRKDETGTEYTGRALRQIKTFMRKYQVAVWIIAHPRTPDSTSNKRPVPGLYSISGSANWANKADYGVVYTRPDHNDNLAVVHVVKVRMGMPGNEGLVALRYDHRVSNFIHDEAATKAIRSARS